MSAPTRSGLRWAVPVGITALVLGGAVLGPVLSASAEVELPDRTPAQLLTDLQTAEVDAFWGTVTQRSDLGLPALPDGVGTEYDADLLSLLTGERRLRVWADGARARVALHGTMAESDVYLDRSQVWVWSTQERTATRLVLPDDATWDDRHDALAQAMPPATPEQVTAYVLDRLEPSTTVTSGANLLVAGRPARELVLVPADDATLVGSVRIAVDAGERVPTRVQVFAEGATTPALEVGFTSLSFGAPDPSVFAFTPPADATVEEHTLGAHTDDGTHEGTGTTGTDAEVDGSLDGARRGAVVGTGWDAVAVTRAPVAVGAVEGELGTFLRALPEVEGSWGRGRLLSSALFTALLTDDGRLLVGAVDDATLLAAAGDPAADLG